MKQRGNRGAEPAAPAPASQPAVVELVDAVGLPRDLVGGKVGPLARLAAGGFPVPAGLVVTTAAWLLPPEQMAAQITAALEGMWAGGERFAVRSSAAAEDSADASYAGQYESYLDVPAERVLHAVEQCRQAAAARRVSVYRSRGATVEPEQVTGTGSGDDRLPSIAVLIQPMVPAAAAGVAFTANPLTGDRHETVVAAVRGLGERLVSGEAVGDEWVVRDGTATPQRIAEHAITAGQAAAIAALAAEVAVVIGGGPQDIEWGWEPAGHGGRLVLLQARPMTALPDPMDWSPPGPGLWMRNFRLGEWLPDPMTPLFADWLLPLLENGYLDGMRDSIGAAIPFPYATVNGWYYNTTPRPAPAMLLPAVVGSRGRLVLVLYQALFNVSRNPAAADRAVLGDLHRRWKGLELPAYRRLVDDGEKQVATAAPADLVRIIDQVGRTAGRQLWFLAIVGGSAWKMEARLTAFADRHLPRLMVAGGPLSDGVQMLLRGLDGIDTHPPPYAVASVDWYRPTLGETSSAPRSHPSRQEAVGAQRQTAEAACLTALRTAPRQREQFIELLQVTRRYAVIREQQARDLTLGWPLLRACALQLGKQLVATGILTSTEQVFFLTHAELTTDTCDKVFTASRRRDRWEAQRRQLAPLTLGTPNRLIGDPVFRAVEKARRGTPDTDADTIIGQPASAGRAAGQVRVLTDPTDLEALQPGEVLVAPATTPSWTPLFATAAAVVTDSGALTAHASIVAREYGIPAVVGTGNATRRLHTGQHVLVNGTAGTVTVTPAPPPDP